MRKFLKRLVKRTYVRILLIGRNSFTKESDKLTENDKICKAICYKLIKHSSSKFLIAPRSGKRYIKNDVLNIFLILDDRKITITNHVYHYDVTLPERDFERISRMYDDTTELIRETYESDMMSQIVYSLSTILKNVSEIEKLNN